MLEITKETMKYLKMLLMLLLPAFVWAEADLEKLPVATRIVEPVVPADYLGRGIDGKVVILFTIDENGRVRDLEIERSTDRNYEEAVKNAVRYWRFEPARSNGEARAIRARLPVVFAG